MFSRSLQLMTKGRLMAIDRATRFVRFILGELDLAQRRLYRSSVDRDTQRVAISARVAACSKVTPTAQAIRNSTLPSLHCLGLPGPTCRASTPFANS
jgi:hypothetical protein